MYVDVHCNIVALLHTKCLHGVVYYVHIYRIRSYFCHFCPVYRGTHGYMAPEVIMKGVQYSFTADWFSLGCVLHKLLLGWDNYWILYLRTCMRTRISIYPSIHTYVHTVHPYIHMYCTYSTYIHASMYTYIPVITM